MPIRNPFSRRAAVTVLTDENMPPSETTETATVGFERVDTIGSKASSILNIRTPRTIDTGEYKMSVVNDSGVYLPVSRTPRLPPLDLLVPVGLAQSIDCPYEQPSPTEDKGLWRPRHLSSRASTQSRSSSGDMEQFSISRESFDSYRRSFDIMARSPISPQDTSVRQSIDSANYHLSSKSAFDRSMDRELPPPEELFEDIGLDDQKAVPRKRGFFSKFSTDSQEKDSSKDAGTPQTTNVARFLMPGRKRGQVAQDSELGRIEQTTKQTRSDE